MRQGHRNVDQLRRIQAGLGVLPRKGVLSDKFVSGGGGNYV
jgi:hypothetical protein